MEDGGKNFSGGQHQRISIARALIHGRKIILVNEGTSALDEKNAQEVKNRLFNKPLITVIMISHHFSQDTKAKLNAVYTL